MAAFALVNHETSLHFEIIPSLKSKARTQSRLDCLNWNAGLCFAAYGVRIGIRSNRSRALEECLPYLPVGWKPSASPIVDIIYSILYEDENRHQPGAGFHLYKDGQQLFRCADKQEFLDRLESDVALHVAEATRRRVFVHAGVVGWGGHAILIPGKSFAGKTALVAALVRAGATYYSDEFAVLDQRGLVHPYARALQMRDTGGFHQTRRAVEDLGGAAGRVPLPVGLVILSRFKSGAKWRPRHISAGQALLGILDNTVSARRGPAAALKTLKQIVTHSFAVKGLRGESQEVVHWISTYFHPQRMFSPASK